MRQIARAGIIDPMNTCDVSQVTRFGDQVSDTLTPTKGIHVLRMPSVGVTRCLPRSRNDKVGDQGHCVLV